MRRTGRTSRIVDFAVDRLLNEGRVVVHDHADYQHTHSSCIGQIVNPVIKRVQEKINPKVNFIDFKFSTIEGFDSTVLIVFTIKEIKCN